MWRHYLLITFRNLQRNKSLFFINLLGLSTGLACTILIYLWVHDELLVDKFHERDAQLYQVMQRISENKEDVQIWEWTPGLLAQTLKEDFPEVEMGVPVVTLNNTGIVTKADQRWKASELYAGEDFFKLFSFELLEGDPEVALQEVNSVVISESMARKLFGRSNHVIGQSLSWERNRENVGGNYSVTGVYKDPPNNSTLQFDLVFSYERYLKGKPDLLEWRNSEPLTFLALKKGTDVELLDKKVEPFLQQKNDSQSHTLFLRKFSEAYLHGNYDNGIQSGGRISYVRLFSLIALFIMLIACINFMNLSTAKSIRRAKEVGIKKTIGANRASLIQQYLTESTLLAFSSLIVALSAVGLLLPHFNLITGKELALTAEASSILTIAGITLLTGLLAGSYPAFYLSAFQPIGILKAGGNRGIGETLARKGLVVFQFTLSMVLIVSTLVVYNQMKYIQNKHLGYDREHVMMFHKDGSIRENTNAFLEEVQKISGVVNASTFDGDMTGNYGFSSTIRWPGSEQLESPIRFGIMIVGQKIVETLDLEIIAGTNFPETGGNRAKVLINKKAADTFGFLDPVGQIITHRRQEYEIVGVVQDFHFESLYDDVKPCILRRGTYGNNIYVRIQAEKEKESIAQIEEVYQEFNPGLPFEFEFLDDNYQKLYEGEKRVATLSRYFAGFAILISCLGLFGLAAFTAERKTKEISIRKILGSSISNIIQLLSFELLQMVFIAIVIALPISLFLSRRWLSSFEFHIEPQVGYFLAAGVTVLVIAAATVSFHGWKAAVANPVDALHQD